MSDPAAQVGHVACAQDLERMVSGSALPCCKKGRKEVRECRLSRSIDPCESPRARRARRVVAVHDPRKGFERSLRWHVALETTRHLAVALQVHRTHIAAADAEVVGEPCHATTFRRNCL